MTYTFAGGQRSAAPGDHHIFPKPVQPGLGSNSNGPSTAKQEPQAKPWAHFVAGGESNHNPQA